MDELMSPAEVAGKYGILATELARWRRHNLGPAYYALGPRTIRYETDTVDAWFTDPANAALHDFPSPHFPPDTTGIPGDTRNTES